MLTKYLHFPNKPFGFCNCLKPHEVVLSVVMPTADPGVVSLIPTQSHTFIEIDHEIISTVILLLLLIQEGLLSVTKESMCMIEVLVNRLVKLAQEKVWLGKLTIST